MSVRLDGDIVFLEGPCRVEDAEPLLRPTIQGTAGDVFLRDWIAPALIGATSVEPGPQGG